MEERKQTSLRGIANKAKVEKGHRFRDLYGCLNAEFLMDCWQNLNQKAASGIDGISASAYAENLQSNIEALAGRLKSKKYRAKLIRRRYIPKGDGKERPLGIPVIEDKLVQQACAKLLSAIYEQDFLDCSYGYRPAHGALEAVHELTFDLQYGKYGHVVEADIKGFFDNMDHDKLLEMLSRRIDDKAFLNLIRKWLKAGVLESDGRVIHPETGTPQGGVISPILANVYLHYVLDLWFEEVVKPYSRGQVLMCRYADDWVSAFQYLNDAERYYRALPKRLKKYNLEVAEDKTRILRFSRFHPSRKRKIAFLGFELYWKADRQGVLRVNRQTARKRLQRATKRISEWIKSNRHLRGSEFFSQLNRRLRGHYNYYGVRGNSESLSRFYKRAIECAFKWLNRRGGKRRSYTWEEFKRVLNLVKIAQPRITEVKHQRVFV
ncbi:MAG TPA: group II intron reverse transcriptase/maturase [Dehalococcoidia bacterium]|nr:group II intron reverse transcriptase/maturase [Dehalococcoidia bacterium]